MKKEKKRRLSLLENSVASTQKKLANPDLHKDAKPHLRDRLNRLTKGRDDLRKELGMSEEKSDEKQPEKKGKKKKANKG